MIRLSTTALATTLFFILPISAKSGDFLMQMKSLNKGNNDSYKMSCNKYTLRVKYVPPKDDTSHGYTDKATALKALATLKNDRPTTPPALSNVISFVIANQPAPDEDFKSVISFWSNLPMSCALIPTFTAMKAVVNSTLTMFYSEKETQEIKQTATAFIKTMLGSDTSLVEIMIAVSMTSIMIDRGFIKIDKTQAEQFAGIIKEIDLLKKEISDKNLQLPKEDSKAAFNLWQFEAKRSNEIRKKLTTLIVPLMG